MDINDKIEKWAGRISGRQRRISENQKKLAETANCCRGGERVPRPKREWYPGATYHVMSRGNRRMAIFKDRYDYLNFMMCVRETMQLYPFKLHAVCLMTNHFHLSLETSKDELWKIMKRMLHSYAKTFNERYHYNGHLFEGRYTACLIGDERYFLEVSRYIHLNPVKAQMVREPLAYEYSSYSVFVNRSDKWKNSGERNAGGGNDKMGEFFADLVETNRVLGVFQHNSREQYRMFVEGKISHAEQELLIQKDMKEDDMWLPW